MNNSSMPESKEQKLFYAKLDDLLKRAIGGRVCHSSFMTPSESYKAEKYFEAKGNKDMICFFGGYFEAQRKQIFLLPEYISLSADEANVFDMIEEELDSAIVPIRIIGSGFRMLSHRDYLGSILALGIEREKLGDICVLDGNSAIVFVSTEVLDYILYELTSIGNDKVKIERISVDKNMESMQKYQGFSDTVASDRLDCVVGALFNLSREKAQNLIKGGFVEFNYETALKSDSRVEKHDIISARGYGKFIIRDLSQSTKKGRLRLFADKYV